MSDLVERQEAEEMALRRMLSERLRDLAPDDGDMPVTRRAMLEAATSLEAKDKELAALREERDHYLSSWEESRRYLAIETAHAETAEARAETAERVFEDILDELGCERDNDSALEAIATLRRERDEAREALKPFAKVSVTHPITLLRMGILREERDIARAITGEG